MTEQNNPLDTISKALAELAANKPNIQNDVIFNDLRFLEFKGSKHDPNYGKGLLWSGHGYTKQFVLGKKPDRFFSTESIDLHLGKHYSINNVPVVTETELGSTVVKSNLREVGRLKGLVVDGSVNINHYLFYDASSDRLGLGIDAPNAALSVSEMGVEVMLGTTDEGKGMVGTYASNGFDIVVDNTPRISVAPNGDVQIGNLSSNPVRLNVNGKISVGVRNPDPNVDLHVNGPVRIHSKLHMYASAPPVAGTFAIGDIVWNENPTVGKNVGWVCTRPGTPGSWNPFGDIKDRG